MSAAPRLGRLVAAVAALGAAAAALVALLVPGGMPPHWALVLTLLALNVAGELTYVRLRHGTTTEELTLFEAVVVVDALLLPPSLAVAIPVVALALASAVRRRPPLKAVFNLGAYAASTAVLVGGYHLVAGNAARFGARSVVALTLGTIGFAAVNLACLSAVISRVEGLRSWTVLRDGASLSAFMALGNVALGSVAVAVAETAPALLPFTALPAVALTFAYRAAAQQAGERERSAALLALSRSLAGGLDADRLLGEFLVTARAAFGAEEARAVLVPSFGAAAVAVRATVDGLSRALPGPQDVALLGLPAAPEVPCDGFTHRLLAPVEAEGHRLGVVLLGFAERPPASAASLLTPLASALGVALRAAEHLERLEEETGKLKAVVDHSAEGILVLDSAGRVLVWNGALEAVTGIRSGDAAGQPLPALLTTTDADGRALDPTAVLARLTPDEPRAVEDIVITRAGGEQRFLRLSHAGIHDGSTLIRDVVVAHDITRERMLDRLKTDFVATISHELRTPLTPIRGYADLLRRRGEGLSPEKRAEFLDVISDRAAHLGRLVEDLLLASQVSGAPAHSITTSPDDLVRLARRAAADFPVSTDRLVLRTPALPVPVICDPTRALQVVGNLIANALAYSPPDSPVEVAVTAHDSNAVITVTDHGRGIPADQLERIFEKFHRVEDPLRMTTSGSGLGLYIARQLSEAMGGSIAVHSVLGVGSTFSVSLPRAAVLPIPRTAPQERSFPATMLPA